MYTTEQIKILIASGSIHDFYNDYYWRKLSHEIIREQHSECQICKSRGRYGRGVITHHVNHLKDRPDLAYSRYFTAKDGSRQRNLIAVCRECHKELHSGEWNLFESKRFQNEEKW